jgi:hypothetical protein
MSKRVPVVQIEDIISKYQRINNLFESLKAKRMKEITGARKDGKFTTEDAIWAMRFGSLPMDEFAISQLNLDRYEPIQSRLEMLNKYHFYEDTIMIGILFLLDEKDNRNLYDLNLKRNSQSFLSILYQTCIALHQTRNFNLCAPYIDLLEKLLIAYPHQTQAFKVENIEKISWDCKRYSN